MLRGDNRAPRGGGGKGELSGSKGGWKESLQGFGGGEILSGETRALRGGGRSLKRRGLGMGVGRGGTQSGRGRRAEGIPVGVGEKGVRRLELQQGSCWSWEVRGLKPRGGEEGLRGARGEMGRAPEMGPREWKGSRG